MPKRSVLVDLDLNKNEIQNAVCQNLSTAPSNPIAGLEYFNTTDKKKYIYDGTKWVDETSEGKIYTQGTGIKIQDATISVDTTVIAQKSDIPTNYVPNTRTVNGKALSSNITLNAGDVGALVDSTKYGATFDMSLSETDYKLTITLKDQDGTQLSSKVVDFPIESVVVGATYDKTNKKIVLTLQNGTTVDVPVGDLIAGLQTEITSTNKLSADLVDNGTTNKVVTQTEKNTWNGKQNAISDLATIRSNAEAGATASTTIAGYGDIVSHNASEFAKTDDLGMLAFADKITNGDIEGTINQDKITNLTSSLSGKQDTISDLSTIRSNASSGKSASTTIATYGDIVTHNASEFTKKIVATNPQLTTSGGVCTWTIENTLGTADVVVAVKEVSTGTESWTDVVSSEENIIIKIISNVNISAGAYKAVIIG